MFCILTEMFDLLNDDTIMVWFSVFHLVGMSSTCTNPVLYGFLNESISQEMMSKMRKFGRYLQVYRAIFGIQISSNGLFLQRKKVANEETTKFESNYRSGTISK